MQGWVGVLPLLTAALAATIPPAPEDAWNPHELVDLFNQRVEADHLYRLVETAAAHDPTRPRRMQFMVKETECQKPEMKKNIEDCKFKKGGVMQDCTAYLDRGPSKDEILIGCSMVNRRHKRQVYYSMATWHCRRRTGCYSIIGYDKPNDNPSFALDKEDMEGIVGNFGQVAAFPKTRGSGLPYHFAMDKDANFKPVEEIDQTAGGISFGDPDQDKEDFGTVKENRSPDDELPNKARIRSRRAPWRCFRSGCHSSIGSDVPNEEKQDWGITKSLNWDEEKKDILHSHTIFTSDETNRLESANPLEVKDIPRFHTIFRGDETKSLESANPLVVA